jgi:hypothetical protein
LALLETFFEQIDLAHQPARGRIRDEMRARASSASYVGAGVSSMHARKGHSAAYAAKRHRDDHPGIGSSRCRTAPVHQGEFAGSMDQWGPAVRSSYLPHSEAGLNG